MNVPVSETNFGHIGSHTCRFFPAQFQTSKCFLHLQEQIFSIQVTTKGILKIKNKKQLHSDYGTFTFIRCEYNNKQMALLTISVLQTELLTTVVKVQTI
jgi:hypothetical protein